MSPDACVVLVPFSMRIEPQCETGLRELETMGFEVRRVGGYSAVDQARNQLATDALRDGFESTLWIDSDIGFTGQDVELLLSHDLPVCCAIYVQKGKRCIAANVDPSVTELHFGAGGGLIPIEYCGAGFLHVHRTVYESIQNQFELPLCNGIFDCGSVPFFLPMIHHEIAHHLGGVRVARYLAEDYAFCYRARESGFKIFADTRIRLKHIGPYEYSWEDAGSTAPRYKTYIYQLVDGS